MVEKAYNPQTFIDIYQGGQNALSNWRRDHPNEWMEDRQEWANALDFSDIHFAKISDNGRIRFNRWDFGGGANFTNATFAGCEVYFEQCTFGEGVDFSGVEFGTSTLFEQCLFRGKIEFIKTKFENLHFLECNFQVGSRSKNVVFENCEFNGVSTRFDKSTFDENTEFANFNNCKFIAVTTSFFAVTFNAPCYFTCCRFSLYTVFQSTYFQHTSTFTDCIFRENIQISGSSNSRLPAFVSCKFYGEFDFFGRSLNTNFAGTIFYELPSFSLNDADFDKLNLTDVKFKIVNPNKPGKWPTKAGFDYTSDQSKLLRLRSLRGAAESSKNHDLERDLYIEERKAERGIYFDQFLGKIKKGFESGDGDSVIIYIGKLIGHIFMIVVMSLYWISSNYGRNVILPIAWFFLFLLGNISSYRLSFNKIAIHGIKNGTLDGALEISKYNNLVDTLAIANSVPIVGNLSLDNEMKQFVFCGGNLPADASVCIPPDGYLMMLISQNLIAGILIFLFGLGLRNYFKIK